MSVSNNNGKKTASKQTTSKLAKESLIPSAGFLESSLPDLSKELYSLVEESSKMYQCMHQNHTRICALVDGIVKLINDSSYKIQNDLDSVIPNSRKAAVVRGNEKESNEEEEKEQDEKEQEDQEQEGTDGEGNEDQEQEGTDGEGNEQEGIELEEMEQERMEQGNEIGKERGAVKRKVSERQKDDNDVENFPQAKRGVREIFSLPLESDRNGSKWTLKHNFDYRPPRRGFIKIMPPAEIYIRQITLINITNTVKYEDEPLNTLAILLISEFFSLTALKTYSFTESPSVLFQDGVDVRPGLYKPGKTVLLDYIKKYANERDLHVDFKRIEKAIRYEIQNIRVFVNRRIYNRLQMLKHKNYVFKFDMFPSSKLTFPPKYDKDDSKWKLRYPDKALGLVELMPCSEIYVNAENLERIKNIANTAKEPLYTLAPLLLSEIFTNVDVRPGLEHGKMVLLDYIQTYADERNFPVAWGCIRRAIHYEIHNIRSSVKHRVYDRLKMMNINNDIFNFDDFPQVELGPYNDLVLSAEDATNNLQWTLSYRQKKFKLVELMPHSDIYVNAQSFNNVENIVNIAEHPLYTLAALLLSEIFTRSALTACSFTGSPSMLSYRGYDVRPELHDRGKMVLLDFVQKYADKQGINVNWNSIKSAIRCEIKNIRDAVYDVLPREYHQKLYKPSCKITLPPEFDKNDSKWTLRYREKEIGLVELMPRSGIYVNAKSLQNVRNIAMKAQKNKIKTLAVLLLSEIFTRSALTTCSFIGSLVLSHNGNDVRPQLNSHGMTVLLDYVKKYAEKWKDNVKMKDIKKSIASKIKSIRNKYL